MIKTVNITLLLFLILISMNANAAPVAERIAKGPGNRITIYFNQLPTYFSSVLSEDKRKISISILGAGVVDSARYMAGSGIIEDVYIKTIKGNIEISVTLNDQFGYTITELPYSKAFSIDFIKWNDILPAEDNYRLALLSINDKLYEVAEKYLRKAAIAGHPDAAALLGILQLKNGKFSLASENLKFALMNKSTILDAYPALSQILRLYNKNDKADELMRQFKNKSGVVNPGTINISFTEADDILEPPTFLDDIDFVLLEDSTASAIDTSNTDSLNNQFANLFSDDSTTKAQNDELMPSLVPDWFVTVLIFGLAFIILLALAIGFLYNKWKKRQLKTLSKEENSFDKEFTTGKKIISSAQISKAYGTDSKIIDKSTDDKKVIEKNDKNNDEPKPADKELPIEKSGEDKLFEILSKVENNQFTDTPKYTEKENVAKEMKLPPKLQLAIHLQEEQKRLKDESIDSMSKGKLPTDSKKLAEFAKKLGIEKGSIETKKALENLEADKKKMMKLSQKFNVDNNDDE